MFNLAFILLKGFFMKKYSTIKVILLNKASILMIFFLNVILTGCVNIPLKHGAENVTIIPHNEFAQKLLDSCKFISPISGTNIHGESTVFLSSDALEKGDLNFLRNTGFNLHANVVFFERHEIITIPESAGGASDSDYAITTHNIQGRAYLCPLNIKKGMWQWELDDHYTY